MNICVANAFFPPHVSGTARGAFLLSKGLSARGHHTVVVTTRPKGTHVMERYGDVTVYRLRSVRYPKLEMLHNALLYYSFLPENFIVLLSILKRHRIDIVHAYGQFFDLTLMMVLACRLLKIPIVLTIGTRMEHTQWLYNSLFFAAEKTLIKHLVARRTDMIIALDRLMRNYVVDRYDIREASIRFIPVAVDVGRLENCDGTAVRKKWNVNTEDHIILSLGNVSNLRSPVSLIRAIPDVLKKFPDSKVMFVGSMYSREGVQLVDRLGLSRSVIFCGRVDYDMVPSYLGACDVEAHDLEFGSGIGLASLEAMASGKPVLSSANEDNFMDLRLGNWKDIVLVEPGNSQAISEAIVKLFSDRELAARIGENGRRYVKEHLSVEAICAKHEGLYSQMLDERGTKRR